MRCYEELIRFIQCYSFCEEFCVEWKCIAIRFVEEYQAFFIALYCYCIKDNSLLA